MLVVFTAACGAGSTDGMLDGAPGDDASTDADTERRDSRPGVVDGGPFDVDGGPFDVDGGPFDVDGGPLDADGGGGSLDMDGGPLGVDGAPLDVDGGGGPLDVDGGPLDVDGGADGGPLDGGAAGGDGGAGAPLLSLTASDMETCAVRADGSLFRWGRFQLTPVQVGIDMDWATVSAGVSSSCALKRGGSLWCWGMNNAGQLGNGTTDPTFTYAPDPARVMDGGALWTRISVGGVHACAIRDDGALFCWGDNFVGELGDGTTTTHTTPVQVGTNLDWTFVSASLSGNRTCCVRVGGLLYCWGAGVRSPMRVDARTDWARVRPDIYSTCSARTDDTVWCDGANWQGELGDGTTTPRSTPVQAGTILTSTGPDIAGSHTCAIATSGTLYCWGDNAFGQLGDGTTTDRLSPTPIGTASDWALVAVGTYYTCGARADGSLYCWGSGTNGRLGTGSTASTSVPTRVW